MINSTTHDDYGKKAGGYLAFEFFIFSGTEQLSISLQGKDATVFIVGQYRASG